MDNLAEREKYVIVAEFEEKSYEAPLYNQLERTNSDVFTPGQMLESRVGFGRGLYLAQSALWQTLGYRDPLQGAALAYYGWPTDWGPPRRELPRFRLNLFLQAKRPTYYARRPRSLRNFASVAAPLWAFTITPHQQRLLDVLAEKTRGKAHVAYAAPAFHTYPALFEHTQRRTIVQNSTFPSAAALSSHSAWYYRQPGAIGIANPNPESIEEQTLLDRVRQIEGELIRYEPGDLTWLNPFAERVIESVREAHGANQGISARFLDDLQTLERLSESYEIGPSLAAYAQISLFTIGFDLNWLVIAVRG